MIATSGITSSSAGFENQLERASTPVVLLHGTYWMEQIPVLTGNHVADHTLFSDDVAGLTCPCCRLVSASVNFNFETYGEIISMASSVWSWSVTQVLDSAMA